MFDFFTPANWFWILVAIMLTCYVKLQAHHQRPIPSPSFSPASIVTFLKGP